jgi:hypothetical protein
MGATTQSPGSPALSNRRVETGRPGSAGIRALLEIAERNPFIFVTLGLLVALHAGSVRSAVGADGWFTLLAGRINASGLPGHDTLTVLTSGREWVDQQWLAHLGFYGLWRIGGWPLTLLSVVALYGGAFICLAATARRLGASDRSVALVAAACFVTGIDNTVLRAQIIAYLLFALAFGILLVDERYPSRRVYLVLPLLVLWANVHGSVVLGAGLVALRGATLAWSKRRSPPRSWLPRAGILLVAPWPCTLVSPYGLALPGYYRRVLDNPTLEHAVSEWGPTTVRNQPLFFVLLIAGLWLVYRSRGILTPFAQLAFLATAIGGLFAVRNVVWFAFVAAATLPGALDARWAPTKAVLRRRVNLTLAALGVVAAVAVGAATASHPRSWFEQSYPRAAAEAVARAASSDPKLRVFADEQYADWLLFVDPQLRGRVAFDIRFELLTSAQLTAIYAFRHEIGPGWIHATAGYRLLVLDPGSDQGAIAEFEHRRGTTVLYRGAGVIALREAADNGTT